MEKKIFVERTIPEARWNYERFMKEAGNPYTKSITEDSITGNVKVVLGI